MASITKKVMKDGSTRWHVSVYAGIDPKTGRKRTRMRSAKTKKEAAIIAARLEVAVSEGSLEAEKPKNYTFAQLYEEWWASYVNTIRESTAFKTGRIFKNHLIPAFGRYRIDQISTRDIQRAVAKWAADTEVAYKQRFIYTKKLFQYAFKAGYIDKNPADNVTLPRAPEKIGESPKYWDKEQLARFFACINPDTDLESFIMFRILVYTGIRREELLALTFGDVGFQNGVLTIDKALVQGKDGKEIIQPPKSAAGYRKIPLDNETMAWLRRWREHFHRVSTIISIKNVSGSAWLFQKKDGQHRSLNTPGYRLRKIIKDNKLTPAISLHSLRKSFITNAIQIGVPVSTVQRLAGHQTPQITLALYTGMNQEAAREGTDKLAEYFSK
ncbi:tyrosine-type recombinase/integrase [Lacticaseibacillus pabuli]|uniref:Tyrosine-type recombinase/integrase n=1 Tax=Lacticaseibacillus pabuli TaxID=3025672 RepID=A0ABY7WPC3_9LACO|nr:site-specific integrase [Lacticaseibacillus sp. KACC 23028]WDF82047.1 tyrosine-type recombinase/integrase [Lacticaseibacillus sp. KACC 23028]